LNGFLKIYGGTLNVHGGSSDSFWTYDNDAYLWMTSGTLDFIDNGVVLDTSNSFSEDITGGTIRTSGNFIDNRGDFNPEMFTLELYESDDALIGISDGSNLCDVSINKSDVTRGEKQKKTKRDRFGNLITRNRANSVSASNDIYCTGIFTIQEGTFNPVDNHLDVTGSMNVYGSLNMDHADAMITVGTVNNDNLNFFNGSVGNLNAGTINLRSWIYPVYGSTVIATTDHTIRFIGGNSYAGLYTRDESTVFGNVEIAKSSNKAVIGGPSLDILVAGDFTVHADNTFDLNTFNLEIQGNLITNPTSEIYTNEIVARDEGGLLEIHTDYTQNCLIDVGNGDVLINGAYEMQETGILNINGGSFTINDPIDDWNYLRGTFNMVDGLYSSNQGPRFSDTSITNIDGGLIDVDFFFVDDPGIFEPTGGTVEISQDEGNWGQIECSNGNYFYNLTICGDTNLCRGYLTSDILVQNDLQVITAELWFAEHEVTVNDNVYISGGLRMTNPLDVLIAGNELNDEIVWQDASYATHTTNGVINVFGNWIFEEGSNALIDSGNSISFLGGWNQFITCFDADAAFGNVNFNQTAMAAWLHSSSTQSMRINGDMTVLNRNFHAQNGELDIAGSLEIQNGTSVDVGNFGIISVESELVLDGELDVGAGNVTINGEFNHNETGILNIDGGDFICDDSSGSWQTFNGTLNFSDGLLEISNNPVNLGVTFIENITGGTFRAGSDFDASAIEHFNPEGGKVELTGSGDSIVDIGYISRFHNLDINKSVIARNDRAQTVTANSNITIDGDLIITEGIYHPNGFSTNVANNLEIYGTLQMTGNSDVITVVNDVYWHSGSNDNMRNGDLFLNGDWYFEDGTDAQLEDPNEVHFVGSENQYIFCFDDNATFGDVKFNQGIADTYLHNDSTQPMRVSDDMRIFAEEFHVQDGELIVSDILRILEGTRMTMGDSGSFVTDSDFSPNGELDVGAGSALIHGYFNLPETGILTIDGGSFICDAPSELVWKYIRGQFNLSDGLFEYTDNCLKFASTCDDNITGGTIRCGWRFSATEAGTFQPSGGTVEIIDGWDCWLYCSNGNYFHNLHVNTSPAKDTELRTDIIVQNNFTFTNGTFPDDSYEFRIKGDWIDNSPYNRFYHSVIFDGENDQNILTDAKFSDLTIDKTTLDGNKLKIATGSELDVIFTLNINNGFLSVEDNTIVNIGSLIDVKDDCTFEIICSAGNEAVITQYGSDYYSMNIESGGIIKAENAIFQEMDVNGLNIKPGAIVDPAFAFTNCIFRDGEDGGSLLTVDNDQFLSLQNTIFMNSAKSSAVNITKSFDVGGVTIYDSSGNLTGPAYENDPNARIHWNGLDIDLEITDVNWSETNPIIGDNILVDVEITNNGTVRSGDCSLGLFFNPDFPPMGRLDPDRTVNVSEIDGGSNQIFTINLITNDVVEEWDSFLQIDSSGDLIETDEGNNDEGPFVINWQNLPIIDDLTIDRVGNEIRLNWSYPIIVDRFKIYKSENPNDFSGAIVYTTTLNEFSEVEMISDQFYYRVTAERDDALRKK